MCMWKQTRRFTWICWAVLEFSLMLLCIQRKSAWGPESFDLESAQKKMNGGKESRERRESRDPSRSAPCVYFSVYLCVYGLPLLSCEPQQPSSALHVASSSPSPRVAKNRGTLTGIRCARSIQGQLNLACINVTFWCTKFNRGTILETNTEQRFTCIHFHMYGGSISEEYSSTMTIKKQHIDAIQSRCDDRLKKEKQLESVTAPLN